MLWMGDMILITKSSSPEEAADALWHMHVRQHAAYIQERDRAVRAEERERCAQLIRGGKTGGSSEYARGWDDACEGHAAAIRKGPS
jgi:hypothetical protein